MQGYTVIALLIVLSLFGVATAEKPAHPFVDRTDHKRPAVKTASAEVKPAKVKTTRAAPAKRHTVAAKPAPTPKPVAADMSSDLLVTFPKTEVTIAVATQARYQKLLTAQTPAKKDSAWSCVVDRNTGLVWETKTRDRGLQDKDNFYSWYEPDAVANGGNAGAPNNGYCRGGSKCDTHSYIQAINKKQLCGYSDWRLPSRDELLSLVKHRPDANEDSVVDTRYFPHAANDWYWSADTDATHAGLAWYVLYANGRQMKASKDQAKRIRLVRGKRLGAIKAVATNQQGVDRVAAASD